MNTPSIINRYIFKELFSPFLISLFFLTFVFLMTQIPEITNMVINYNADLLSILLMIVYTIPRFLEFTIPMSVMISILLTFMRMAGDNEIVALKGAGTTIYKLLPPVLLFCLMGVLLTLLITVYGVSWGKMSIKEKSIELARSSIDATLQARQFNSSIKDITMYVGHVDMKTRKLTHVFIEDKRTKGVVSISLAPYGRIIQMENKRFYTIRLHDGIINQVNMGDKSVNSLGFSDYDINIDLGSLARKKRKTKDFDEKSLKELYQYIKSDAKGNKIALRKALIELHEKFSIPFACLTLGILSFPLGIQSASLRKSSGFSLGIGFFLLYYFLLAAGWSAGETGNYPPVVGMWLPNVIMGALGIYFLVKNAKEEPVQPPQVVINAGRLVKDAFIKRFGKEVG